MANETVTDSLEAVLTRIEGKIDSLEKRIDERFDQVDERFDKIEERLTKVEIGQVELKGEIKALDERLTTEIKDRTKPFGGFMIIFAGDFRQLEPVGAKETELLFSLPIKPTLRKLH